MKILDFINNYNFINTDAFEIIQKTFGCEQNDIKDLELLNKGMTNHSFCFNVYDERYIMRIPGEGTEKLVNRSDEYENYLVIKNKGLCDNPIYINPDNGYKITRFLNNVRPCDSYSEKDLIVCMKKLKEFHNMKLKVSHNFDIYNQIDYYEKLRGHRKSVYSDYDTVKNNVFELKRFVDSLNKDFCMSHIDSVCDNFLFYNNNGREELQLTDWEYAGMQDPHVDLAMFCIYSMYDNDRIDRLIDIYFDDKCSYKNRIKIYCYIAQCGLLWSNWCEYKSVFEIDFGDYALSQYDYARKYYEYAKDMIGKIYE